MVCNDHSIYDGQGFRMDLLSDSILQPEIRGNRLKSEPGCGFQRAGQDIE